MATPGALNETRNVYESGIPEANSFYSVEIQVEKAEFMYQFKIWKLPTTPNFVLIKEGSDIINWIQPGDVLRMTYYSDDLAKQSQQLPTRILNVIKQDVGRFRGHFMVTLAIIEN